jgi:hypothetical protein
VSASPASLTTSAALSAELSWWPDCVQRGGSNAVCTAVYTAVRHGDIQRAIDLVQRHHPALLQDHRLLFKLRRQQFIELAQSEDFERRRQAVGGRAPLGSTCLESCTVLLAVWLPLSSCI